VDKLSYLNSSVLTQVLWWSDYFWKTEKYPQSVGDVEALRLHVARTARKEGNFELAQRELGKYFASGCGLATRSAVFQDIVEEVLSGAEAAVRVNWSEDNTRAFRETSKLLYNMERTEEALKVCSVTALGISRSIVSAGDQAPAELREVGTKVLLTLGKLSNRGRS
jgi:hypothetical protein